jgi:uncharacterized protein YjiS (DUF1127 family)
MTKPETGGLAAPVSAVAMLLAAARVLGRVVQVLRNRREVNSLRELDERCLKDIGLTRADVEGALSSPLHRDPSLILVGQAHGRGAGRRTARQTAGDRVPAVPARNAAPHCA